ncbi:MAG: UvrB/UvrC motif-containing protein [Planctomycetes bacterium]|nr:UvrB/UvrC motif-containing protein [Planctomycetota bacterium]
MYSCDRCDSPATVHMTDIKQGEKTERHFCEECARAMQVPQPSKELAKLLKSFEPIHSMARRKLAQTNLACPECGMTYAEFRQQGRFGCPHDYKAFGDEVVKLLQRIHGSTEYSGPAPDGRTIEGGKLVDEVTLIRARLEQAVAEEDYEQAARLRDEIRQQLRARGRPSGDRPTGGPAGDQGSVET